MNWKMEQATAPFFLFSNGCIVFCSLPKALAKGLADLFSGSAGFSYL
ncbi:hypothetical protein OM416_12330 [Paenibacillus sp. LS1]|nr:hypothetical protein [Paenibacillus sp. LS1]